MKIKINDRIYDSDETPVMLIMGDADKNNIKSMDPDCMRYVCYPDYMDWDTEIADWVFSHDVILLDGNTGLSQCRICKCSGRLTTDCAGYPLNAETLRAIESGDIDYVRDKQWTGSEEILSRLFAESDRRRRANKQTRLQMQAQVSEFLRFPKDASHRTDRNSSSESGDERSSG